jgi:outer membrane protein assembly factor BamB
VRGQGGWCASLCLALGLVVAGSAVADPSADASTSGKASRRIVVLDARTGRSRWEASLSKPYRFYGPIGLGQGLVVAAVSACNEELGPHEHERSKRLDAFDAVTGERRWSKKGYNAVATKTMTWQQSPNVGAAARGVVVAQVGRLGSPIRGLAAQTGTVRWTIRSSFLGVSPTLVFATDGTFNIAGRLDAYNRRTGRRSWSFPTRSDPAWGLTFDVVAADNETVVVVNGGYLIHYGDQPESPSTVFVLDARTGRERTRFTAANPQMLLSDFAMDHGLLVYADGTDILGRDLRDGRIRWTRPSRIVPAPPFFYTPPQTIRATSDGGTFLLGGPPEGSVDAVDSLSGAIRWSAGPQPRQYLSVADRSLVIVNGFTGTDSDPNVTLHARSTATGRPLWRRDATRLFPGTSASFGVAARGSVVALYRSCDEG